MREQEFEREFWHLSAAEPGIEKSFKRWNVIVISLLVFLLFGVIIAELGSETLRSPIAGSAPHQGMHQGVHRG